MVPRVGIEPDTPAAPILSLIAAAISDYLKIKIVFQFGMCKRLRNPHCGLDSVALWHAGFWRSSEESSTIEIAA
jgi:hypothetical protein